MRTSPSATGPPVRTAGAVTNGAKAGALIAPVALVAGWTIAARLQPAGFSTVGSTISDLAATTAQARWVMTIAFVTVGMALFAVAAGLHTVAARARAAIAIGGAAVLVVAAAPLPDYGQVHSAAALVALGALAVWPLLATDPRAGPTRAMDRAGNSIAVVCLVMVAFLEVAPEAGGLGGLLERVVTTGELAWLAVVTFTYPGRP